MGFAQSASSIISQFKEADGAEYQHVPKVLLNLAAKSAMASADDAGDRAQAKLMSKISSITVLDLDDCSKGVRQRFAKAVEKLDTNGYEELLKAKEDGETARILMKSKKDKITELLIIEVSNDEAEFVIIKGNIAKSDIDVLISDDDIYKIDK